eukprot:SM004223S15708  [mRNA]  locus=s4223:27:1203:+ [translate_table: standard]
MPLPALHKVANKYEVGKVSDEEEKKQRAVKGILNKLTPQNFERLFEQVKEIGIATADTLRGVISQIFEKALLEPTFCEMYAQFCAALAQELPNFGEGDEKVTFKRVLLNKCQEEFERGEREQEEAEQKTEIVEGQDDGGDGTGGKPEKRALSEAEQALRRSKARKRMLGNIRFIGELFRKSMLTERIMHECIVKLLGNPQAPEEEDVEALCKLMATIGSRIDHPKAKDHINAYMNHMSTLAKNQLLSSRIRFMVLDIIERRANNWEERRKVEGPKKIEDVHRDAVTERRNAVAEAGRAGFQRGSSGGGGGGGARRGGGG